MSREVENVADIPVVGYILEDNLREVGEVNDSETGQVVNKKHICAINFHMIPAKLSYFLNFVRYSVCEYLVLFYVSAGFTSSDAGWICGLQLFGGFVSAPLWSLLADKKGIHKLMSLFICVMAALTVCMQPFLTETLGDGEKTVCPFNGTFSGTNGMSTSSKTSFFYIMLVATLVSSSFDNSITSFVDAGVVHRIHTSTTLCDYGQQRVYGALGYIVGGLLYSTAINYFPHGDISCCAAIFIVYFIATSCLALSTYWMFTGIQITRKGARILFDVKKQVILSLRNAETIVLFLIVFVNGFSQGVWFSFLLLYMKELNAPTLLLGCSNTVGCITAIFVYIYCKRLIDWLDGPIPTMALTCFVWALKFMCITHIKSPYLVPVIDLTHGFAYALPSVAAVEYIKDNVDPRISTTMFGINTTSNTFGLIVANIVGGYIYKEFGAKKLFLGCTVASSIGGLFVIMFLFTRKGFRA